MKDNKKKKDMYPKIKTRTVSICVWNNPNWLISFLHPNWTPRKAIVSKNNLQIGNGAVFLLMRLAVSKPPNGILQQCYSSIVQWCNPQLVCSKLKIFTFQNDCIIAIFGSFGRSKNGESTHRIHSKDLFLKTIQQQKYCSFWRLHQFWFSLINFVSLSTIKAQTHPAACFFVLFRVGYKWQANVMKNKKNLFCYQQQLYHCQQQVPI